MQFIILCQLYLIKTAFKSHTRKNKLSEGKKFIHLSTYVLYI